MRIKLDNESIRYITLFESTTGAHVKDCLIENNKIIFVVKSGHASMAIGRNGMNVRSIQKAIGKQIEVIEFSEDPAQFVANVFRPIKVDNVNISTDSDGQKIMHISPSKTGVLAKMKLKKAKSLALRYFKIRSVEFG